jgi:integrase
LCKQAAQALRWTDFNEKTREITIVHTIYKQRLKAPKSATSVRTLRLHASVAALLVSQRKQSAFAGDSDFIFCREDGSPLHQATILRRLYKAMDAAKIKRGNRTHGFHIFRHTAGSLMYARSRDLKLVQGALGHSGISITSDTYVHLDGERVAEGTEMLAEEILGDFLTNCDRREPHGQLNCRTKTVLKNRCEKYGLKLFGGTRYRLVLAQRLAWLGHG